MKRMILDKSAAQGAAQGVLREAKSRFRFYLTDPLYYEMYTDTTSVRPTLFAKVMTEIGDEWLPMSRDVIKYEIEEGFPGSLLFDLPGARRTLSDSYEPTNDAEIAAYEKHITQLGQVVHDPLDEKDYVQTRRIQSAKALFERIEIGPESVKLLSDRAEKNWRRFARENGLQASIGFIPRPGWFCYGLEAAGQAFLHWKLWACGDAPADPRHPANPGFDLEYVAYASLVDGLVSNDNLVLPLAWACWPEKREDIYTYNKEKREICRFVPKWER